MAEQIITGIHAEHVAGVFNQIAIIAARLDAKFQGSDPRDCDDLDALGGVFDDMRLAVASMGLMADSCAERLGGTGMRNDPAQWFLSSPTSA